MEKEMAHWEHREEAGWQRFQFNQPFAKGLRRLREDVLAKTDFDPATLWQWGTMQAMAVLEILKNCEEQFGEAGQKVVMESLRKIGYDTARQILEGTTRPEGMSDAEYMSYFVTTVNRIMYASLEDPKIDGEEGASFHILWCPHQDHYQAFDCRVQRYIVVGLIDAFKEFGGVEGMQVQFDYTIPAGAETCHFSMWIGSPDDTKWNDDTAAIGRKALQRIADRQ